MGFLVFYSAEMSEKGKTKAEALQIAQQHLLGQRGDIDSLDQDQPQRYTHPYYWAPFFLTGASGNL